MVMYLLICCDTRWTTKLLRLSLYLKHVALSRATITVTPTILTTVHGEVVSRAKLREAGITAKFMYHILVINFMPNNSILLTHAAFGWNAIRIYGNNRFSFQFIRRQTWLTAKIFTCGGIFKLGTDHILWI